MAILTRFGLIMAVSLPLVYSLIERHLMVFWLIILSLAAHTKMRILNGLIVAIEMRC